MTDNGNRENINKALVVKQKIEELGILNLGNCSGRNPSGHDNALDCIQSTITEDDGLYENIVGGDLKSALKVIDRLKSSGATLQES